MPLPPTHMLIGAGAAEVARTGVSVPRWRAWLVAALVAALPDADFLVGRALGDTSAYHGTFTHSIIAVVVAALLAWAIADRRWAVIVAAGYGSHLVADLLDDRGRTNVLLGWPFTHERPLAIARIFPTVPIERGEGVTGALLSLVTPEVLGPLLFQTAVGVFLLLVLIMVAEGIRRVKR